MIDFKNATYLKLSEVPPHSVERVADLLSKEESIISAFRGMRDFVVFTNYRIIAVNVQGLTGKKVDYTSLPYKSIVAYSVETAGTFDLDAELDLWFSGLGKVRLEFKGSVNVKEISNLITSRIFN